MILTTLLLLSPALSPLAPPQEAERKVVIRRQGVESGRPAPHPEHVHHHGHQDGMTDLETEWVELEVMAEVLAEIEALETMLVELENEKLALELAALESDLAGQERELKRMHLEKELHRGHQEPGKGRETARIVITFADGDTEVLEWVGTRGEIHQEIAAYLGDEECEDEAEDCCGDCDEDDGDCEDSWEEELVFTAVPETGGSGADVFFFGGAGGMGDCACEGCPMGGSSPGQVRVRTLSQPEVGFGWSQEAPRPQERRQRIVLGGAAPEAGRHQQRIVLGGAAPGASGQAIVRMAPAGRVMPATPPVPPTPSVAIRRAPAAGSDLERRVDELDMRLDRIEAMLGELLERR